MKKPLAIILLLSFTLSFTACQKIEAETSADSSASTEATSSTASESDNSTTAAATSKTPAETSQSAPQTSETALETSDTDSKTSEEPSDIPDDTSAPETDAPISITIEPNEDGTVTIGNIHDLSTGNFIYNPNVTDTSNSRRYYGDFSWVKESKVLWTSTIDETPWPVYDADAAVAYGRAHWDDGVGLCAPFISRCITEGGITEYTESSTSITLQLLHSRLGFGQFVQYNKSDHTITLPKYARPGDVIQIYCSYEGAMIHSLLMVGTDDEGKLKVVCHNLRNSGADTFHIDYLNDPCYDCESETVEVFFYHFYRDDDTGLPEEVVKNKDILLWEEKGYIIKGEKYDRKAALEYAKNNPYDGFGYYGAEHTWEILNAGNISVGYPNQSAMFLQLLKSHLGQAHSEKINADRTITMPEYAKAGDIGFIYCPYDGTIVSSFIISGSDENNQMITLSYDLLNDGKTAFRVDSNCIGCGDDLKEVIVYHFDD